MKKMLISVATSLCLLVFSSGAGFAGTEEPAAEAATPLTILYQGRLTDLGGVPRPGPVDITFSLYTDAAAPTALWTEAHPAVPLTDGVFSVLLGSLTAFPVNAWSDPDRWLGISVDGAAEMVPRLRVASVPFAIEANRLNGKRSTDFELLGAAAIAAAGVSAQLKGSDATPPNEGSNQVHWNNLYGVPGGFADGQDDVGGGVLVHGQLQGLDANDHPQYALNSILQVSDGNPPNLGSNRVHWDNLGGVPDPLAQEVLPREWLAPGSVDSTRIGAAAIASSNLAPGSVTESRIAPGAVGPAQVRDNSLTTSDIQNGSLTGDDVENGTLSGADILDGSLFTTDIANGSILGVDLAAGAVGATQVQDNSLTGGKIQDGSVSGSKLEDDSVPGPKLESGAVGSREIAAGAVNGDKVADGSLSSADIVDVPGVAYLTVPGFVDTVSSLSGQTLASITIQAPGPGRVIVTAWGEVFLVHDQGTGSRVTLAVSDVPDVVDDIRSAVVALPGAFPSEFYFYPLDTSSVFTVPSAGSFTFYVTAKKGVQPRLPSIHDLRIQGLYVNVQY